MSALASYVDMAERWRAQNIARYPQLASVRTHPALDVIPLMTDAEMARLVWSIGAHGLRDPIHMADDVIVDGRCRFIACKLAGVEPRFKPFAYEGDQDGLEEAIEAHVISMNLFRQSYTKSQIAILDALVEAESPGYYPEGWVNPEARLIVKYPFLTKSVTHFGMSLAEAHAKALENEREAAQRAGEHQRLETLRLAAPFVAALVDERSLTLDEGLARAEELAAAPIVAEHVQAIRTLGRRMTADALEIGRRLTECRRVIRSDWAGWLERELGLNYRSALNFMRVYELAAGRSENFSDLRLPTSGLYLLARPGTPEAVRDDIITRAAAGEEIGLAEIESALAGERPVANRLGEVAKAAAKLAEEQPDDPLVHELRALIARIAEAQ
jgi:hypothetical protein